MADRAAEPLLSVDDLTVQYATSRAALFGRRRYVHAVDGVSFDIGHGETLGLVGESGSGKSTTGRAILRRVAVARGRIRFDGRDITAATGRELRSTRRHMQLVYQDPYTSLNPRMRVRDIIAEPMLVHGIGTASERDARVDELISLTGLPADAGDRYPHAFSGGQRQRVGIARALAARPKLIIARALAARPKLIIADEPVSALDVSIQAQVVNLMEEIQQRFGVSFLFIAHDLSVVRHVSRRIGIMYAGQLVELADSDDVFERPAHPYTESLLSALPVPDPAVEATRERIVLSGEPPDPHHPPTGCRFATRCPYRPDDRCDNEVPARREIAPGHVTACHFAEQFVAGELTRRLDALPMV